MTKVISFVEAQRLVHELRLKAQSLFSYPLQATTYYGIPRGGLMVAALLRDHHSDGIRSARECSDEPQGGDVARLLVDDVIATGATAEAVIDQYPNFTAVLALVDKRMPVTATRTGVAVDRPPIRGIPVVAARLTTEWVQFPWEHSESGPEDAVRRLIEYVGSDLTRPSLQDTPSRYLRFLDELREAGTAEIATNTFESSVGDLIVTARIPFASLCEHHMLPYWGEASVGYIPHGRLIGLSKTARILAKHAAGLTVQEHLTHAVAKHVAEAASTSDVAVVTTAVHTCMVVRGVRAIGSRTSASAMLGMFRESPALRAEFFAVVEGASRL